MSEPGVLDHNRLLQVLQSDHTDANLQLSPDGEQISEFPLLSAEAILSAEGHADNQFECKIF